jgi:class 3 adenylate cyclase
MPDRNDHPEPQRKQIAIILADLSGSTAMSEDLDPEQVRESVNRYFGALSAAVSRYRGHP